MVTIILGDGSSMSVPLSTLISKSKVVQSMEVSHEDEIITLPLIGNRQRMERVLNGCNGKSAADIVDTANDCDYLDSPELLLSCIEELAEMSVKNYDDFKLAHVNLVPQVFDQVVEKIPSWVFAGKCAINGTELTPSMYRKIAYHGLHDNRPHLLSSVSEEHFPDHPIWTIVKNEDTEAVHKHYGKSASKLVPVIQLVLITGRYNFFFALCSLISEQRQYGLQWTSIVCQVATEKNWNDLEEQLGYYFEQHFDNLHTCIHDAVSWGNLVAYIGLQRMYRKRHGKLCPVHLSESYMVTTPIAFVKVDGETAPLTFEGDHTFGTFEMAVCYDLPLTDESLVRYIVGSLDPCPFHDNHVWCLKSRLARSLKPYLSAEMITQWLKYGEEFIARKKETNSSIVVMTETIFHTYAFISVYPTEENLKPYYEVLEILRET